MNDSTVPTSSTSPVNIPRLSAADRRTRKHFPHRHQSVVARRAFLVFRRPP
jgi:hypothetical protein